MKKLFILILSSSFVLNAQYSYDPPFKIMCDYTKLALKDHTLTYLNTGLDAYGVTTLSACMAGPTFNTCKNHKGTMVSENVFQIWQNGKWTKLNLDTKIVESEGFREGEVSTRQCR